MQVQIFGTKKCKDTNKAIRFFKERRIKIQFVDLAEKEISKGELRNISRSVPIEDLIDKNGKEYKKRNLEYIIHDIENELLAHPLLFRTPIVRFASKSTCGHDPDTWKKWAKEQ
jgi:arsenate reductase-like glutaredoxin family protein